MTRREGGFGIDPKTQTSKIRTPHVGMRIKVASVPYQIAAMPPWPMRGPALDPDPEDRRERLEPAMKAKCLALTLLIGVFAIGPALAGSFMHQSPKLYHRVHSPCRDGEVMKRTGGGGRRGVLSCAPR